MVLYGVLVYSYRTIQQRSLAIFDLDAGGIVVAGVEGPGSPTLKGRIRERQATHLLEHFSLLNCIVESVVCV